MQILVEDSFWSWEKDPSFDIAVSSSWEVQINKVTWVNAEGNPVLTDRGEAVNDHLDHIVTLVKSGEVIGDVDQLTFRGPNNFLAGHK